MDCPTEEGDILGDSLGFQGVCPLTSNLIQLQERGLRRSLGTSGPVLSLLAWEQIRTMWKQPAFPIKEMCTQTYLCQGSPQLMDFNYP